MELLSLQRCRLFGWCEWPVLAQMGYLDHSPASSSNAGGLWQATQYVKDFSHMPQGVAQKENHLQIMLFIQWHATHLHFECLYPP